MSPGRRIGLRRRRRAESEGRQRRGPISSRCSPASDLGGQVWSTRLVAVGCAGPVGAPLCVFLWTHQGGPACCLCSRPQQEAREKLRAGSACSSP